MQVFFLSFLGILNDTDLWQPSECYSISDLNMHIFTDKYVQEFSITTIPYYMCEFCQNHCVNYTDMQLQYVLKPHNDKKDQNRPGPIHIILKCSVWKYIIEDMEWLINLPEDIHSIIF